MALCPNPFVDAIKSCARVQNREPESETWVPPLLSTRVSSLDGESRLLNQDDDASGKE